MSIESEINRISNNVSNSLTAVADMGASVPVGANSNNLPDLIRAIPTATIVQGTGQSTTNIMSQKAVTDLFNSIRPYIPVFVTATVE